MDNSQATTDTASAIVLPFPEFSSPIHHQISYNLHDSWRLYEILLYMELLNSGNGPALHSKYSK